MSLRLRNKIWQEAQQDALSTRLTTRESDSYIKKGVKIENIDGDIRIYNTKFKSGFYTELTESEMQIFYKNGWKVGCYTIAMENQRKSLELLSQKIINEVNNRKNHRHYNALRQMRSEVMSRFTDTLRLLQKQLN